MPQRLPGKTAIVTGASSGIGAATARTLATHGANVVLAARRTDRLEQLAADIEADRGKALVVPTDVTDRSAVEALAARAREAFGRIDALVNNAGVMPLSTIEQLHVDDWDRMIDVNIKGVLYGVAAVLPAMLEQGSGHIINVSSLASRRPWQAGVVYAATKFAVRAISDGLRLELSAHHNIRVTDIEPGVVRTELQDHIEDEAARRSFEERWSDKRPLEPEDVADAILYVLTQDDRVNVNEILLRPTDQPT